MSKNVNGFLQMLTGHKYLWTFLLFVLFAGFVDENSVYNYYNLSRHNAELRDEIAAYEAEYQQASEAIQHMEQSAKAVEEVARVTLRMKSDDEDLYVIE